MRIVRIERLGQRGNIGDEASEIAHVPSMGFKPRSCKENLYGKFSNTTQTSGMDTWTHRERFKELATGYRKAKGISLDQLGLKLGMTRNTLMSDLYKSTGKPGIEKLQKAAELFGCSVNEFIYDPGDDMEGTLPSEGMSEAKRLVSKLIFKEIASSDVSDEQAMAYLQVLKTVKGANSLSGKDK